MIKVKEALASFLPSLSKLSRNESEDGEEACLFDLIN